MKKIYFVRHGLTHCNIEGRTQGMDDELELRGIEQAHKLAERISKLEFSTLLSSDMLRARQTAEIVKARTEHPIIESPLYREVMYPTSLTGVEFVDPRIKEYFEARALHRDDLDYKFEDEESARELRARAHEALAHAASFEGDVVVVTHGKTLRHIVLRMLLGEDFLPHTEHHAERRMLTINTGITVCAYHDDKWSLLTWNDHAHLG